MIRLSYILLIKIKTNWYLFQNNSARVSQMVGCPILLLCGQEDILKTDEYESDDCV